VTLILLTNDDGIEAEGLRVLEECIADLGEITVVAPDRERSAVSHGLTIRASLDEREVRGKHFELNGTPADCVIHALRRILPVYPDLVISGINHGANLGDDIMYSGTVAAAREASRRGIASLAVSQAYDDSPIRFDRGKKFIHYLVKTMLERSFNGGLCLNVNIPVKRIRGIKITRQGCALHFPHYNSLSAGMENGSSAANNPGSQGQSSVSLDYEAISEHYISVTPLQRDQTDYAMADRLQKDAPQLFRRFPGIGLIGR
jgi:5'-nucleotidase